MDPTYPLLPVVSVIAAFLMLLTSLVTARQTWSPGVLMLCLWLFAYCLVQGSAAVIWSDNVDNIAPVWCDISSRIELCAAYGVPACSLVITRRVCNITRLRTMDALSTRQASCAHCQWQTSSHTYLCIAETLRMPPGSVHWCWFPSYSRRASLFALNSTFLRDVAPHVVLCLDYVVQTHRFAIIEEIGCSSAVAPSASTILIIDLWSVILPLISAIFYCPRIIWTFYRQRKDVDAFLQSNGTINRARYLRVLTIGCLDIFITLPSSILLLLTEIGQLKSSGKPFYTGWQYTHQHFWITVSESAAEWRSDLWSSFQVILAEWLYPILSILIFAIYGLTGEARATYRHWFWIAVGPFGFKPPMRKDIPDIKFNSPRRRSFGLSTVGSSMTNDADSTLSTQRNVGGGSVDDTVEIVLAKDHSCAENGSVGAPTQQILGVDEAEGDVDKVKVV